MTLEILELLSMYSDLLAANGPDSNEARQFFEAHRHLPMFEENALDLYRLQKEDWKS